jgi:cold shock CspA family protein
MPKQRTPKGAASAEASPEINDLRFSNFATDPRFRLPSKKHTRTKINKRFSRMLKDEDFSNSANVDQYGRKLSSSGKKNALKRLYVPDEDEQDVELKEDEVVKRELERVEGYNPARGRGFLSSDNKEYKNEDVGIEIEQIEATEFLDMLAEQAGVEIGEVSSRFAVVNLD